MWKVFESGDDSILACGAIVFIVVRLCVLMCIQSACTLNGYLSQLKSLVLQF